jgi:hypothetical protein
LKKENNRISNYTVAKGELIRHQKIIRQIKDEKKQEKAKNEKN